MTVNFDERERRVRREWIKQLADVAGSGSGLDPEDIAALPEAHRSEARAISRVARALHEDGRQQDARLVARERFAALEERIGASWMPPRERPDPDLLDEIRGVRI